MQHGTIHGFQANQNFALVEYASREDAFKAQKALNGCQLGNTTIMAELMKNDLLQQPQQQQVAPPPQAAGSGGGMWPGQSMAGGYPGQHGQQQPPNMSYRGGGGGGSGPIKPDTVGTAHWNGATPGYHAGGGMWSSGPTAAPPSTASPWGAGLLQGDLLGGESM